MSFKEFILKYLGGEYFYLYQVDVITSRENLPCRGDLFL